MKSLFYKSMNSLFYNANKRSNIARKFICINIYFLINLVPPEKAIFNLFKHKENLLGSF